MSVQSQSEEDPSLQNDFTSSTQSESFLSEKIMKATGLQHAPDVMLLTTLTLTNLGIIPTFFTRLTCMRQLTLKNGTIQRIENLHAMKDLLYLDLSNNRISKLKNLHHNTLLQVLIVDFNPITQIKCKHVEYLPHLHHLSACKVEVVSLLETVAALARLPALRYLSFQCLAQHAAPSEPAGMSRMLQLLTSIHNLSNVPWNTWQNDQEGEASDEEDTQALPMPPLHTNPLLEHQIVSGEEEEEEEDEEESSSGEDVSNNDGNEDEDDMMDEFEGAEASEQVFHDHDMDGEHSSSSEEEEEEAREIGQREKDESKDKVLSNEEKKEEEEKREAEEKEKRELLDEENYVFVSPICSQNHYRAFVISNLPQLKALDTKPVLQSEVENSHEVTSAHFELRVAMLVTDSYHNALRPISTTLPTHHFVCNLSRQLMLRELGYVPAHPHLTASASSFSSSYSSSLSSTSTSSFSSSQYVSSISSFPSSSTFSVPSSSSSTSSVTSSSSSTSVPSSSSSTSSNEFSLRNSIQQQTVEEMVEQHRCVVLSLSQLEQLVTSLEQELQAVDTTLLQLHADQAPPALSLAVTQKKQWTKARIADLQTMVKRQQKVEARSWQAVLRTWEAADKEDMNMHTDYPRQPTPSVEGICYGPHAMHCGVWGERAQEIVYSGLHRLDRKVQITPLFADKERAVPRQFEYNPAVPNLMVVGTREGEVHVINPHSRKAVGSVRVGDSCGVLGLTWLHGDPRKFVAGADAGQLHLYDTALLQDNRKPLVYAFTPFPRLTSVSVNSSDELLLASGHSYDVNMYDLRTGKYLRTLPRLHKGFINVLKFANTSRDLFATSSFDGTYKLWDLRTNLQSPVYTRSSDSGLVMLVWSHDDEYILTSAVDNEVRQYCSGDGALHTLFDIKRLHSDYNYTRSYYMNHSQYIIVGSCEESLVRVFNAKSGKFFREIDVDVTAHNSITYVQSLRADPFHAFHFTSLLSFKSTVNPSKLLCVNMLSTSDEANSG